MVDIAKRFIQTFKKLPPEKQEYYGLLFLEAIEADQKLETAFAANTPEQWKKMFREVVLRDRLGLDRLI